MKKTRILIKKDGKTEIRVEGGQGDNCLTFTKAIRRNLRTGSAEYWGVTDNYFSFPSSAWECSLASSACRNVGLLREAELERFGFPSGAWEPAQLTSLPAAFNAQTQSHYAVTRHLS